MLPEITGYFGPKGRGKTSAALRDLRRFRRRIVVDLKGAGASHEIATFNADVIEDGNQLWERLIAAGDDRPFNICWRGFVHEGLDAFERVNRYAWALGNLALLWDEVDGLTGGRLPNLTAAWRIANMNRGKGIALAFTARRPALVPRSLTANADRLVAFRTTEPRDRQYLSEFMGEGAAQLPALADWHALIWTDGQGCQVKKMQALKNS